MRYLIIVLLLFCDFGCKSSVVDQDYAIVDGDIFPAPAGTHEIGVKI